MVRSPVEQLVWNVQVYLYNLNRSGGRSLPRIDGLYDSSVGGHTLDPPQYAALPVHFDPLFRCVARAWTEHRGGAVPPSLEALVDAGISGSPNLGPFSFQESPRYESGRWVHVHLDEALGAETPAPAERVYCYPRLDRLGPAVGHIAARSLDSGVPLYFKFLNLATGQPSPALASRTDRIVMFFGDDHRTFARMLVQELTSLYPEAFVDRRVNGFGEHIADGFARADEMSPEQEQYFPRESFNSLCAQMAFHAMVEVGRRTICDLSVLPLPDDATSIRDVFEEELTKVWKGDVDPALPERIIATGLRPSRMQADGFKKREIDDVTDAVKHSAKRVLPLVNTRVLVPLFEEPVTRLGPFFGIDHKNISRAVPMSDAARSDHETRISPLLEA